MDDEYWKQQIKDLEREHQQEIRWYYALALISAAIAGWMWH